MPLSRPGPGPSDTCDRAARRALPCTAGPLNLKLGAGWVLSPGQARWGPVPPGTTGTKRPTHDPSRPGRFVVPVPPGRAPPAGNAARRPPRAGPRGGGPAGSRYRPGCRVERAPPRPAPAAAAGRAAESVLLARAFARVRPNACVRACVRALLSVCVRACVAQAFFHPYGLRERLRTPPPPARRSAGRPGVAAGRGPRGCSATVQSYGGEAAFSHSYQGDAAAKIARLPTSPAVLP